MRFLISAGPTVEPIDDVRYISNRSSGKMGVALAVEVERMGHQATVVHGPISTTIPDVGVWTAVQTATEMLEELKRNFDKADVLIMAAAVCDVRPSAVKKGKFAKSELESIELTQNPDLIKSLSLEKGKQLLIAFSLGEKVDEDVALRKLKEKGADWIVVNDTTSFDNHEGNFSILNSEGRYLLEPSRLSKIELSSKLIYLAVKHTN